MEHVRPGLLALLAAFSLAGAPGAARAFVWPDTFVARLEALALLESLNAELLSHDSATVTLQRWCDQYGLARGQRIIARRVPGAQRLAGGAERLALRVGPAEPVAYRHVQLICGGKVLSEADNWYLPARLTPEMNRLLNETQTPFGVVVRSLGYQRRTLSSELLFRPLPDAWALRPAPLSSPGGVLEIPAHVLRHDAVLTTPDGAPFSLVSETYTGEVLAISPPAP